MVGCEESYCARFDQRPPAGVVPSRSLRRTPPEVPALAVVAPKHIEALDAAVPLIQLVAKRERRHVRDEALGIHLAAFMGCFPPDFSRQNGAGSGPLGHRGIAGSSLPFSVRRQSRRF